MKVSQIQSKQSFQAKQRFLNSAQKRSVSQLVEKMSKDTSFKSDGMFFEITALNRLKIKDNAEFVGARITQNKNKLYDKIHFTVDKTQLVIDTESGKIEDYHKPFFTTWAKVMKNVDKYLGILIENFNNPKIIQKENFKISGMTPEALKVFQREVENLFKNRKKK